MLVDHQVADGSFVSFLTFALRSEIVTVSITWGSQKVRREMLLAEGLQREWL
jgi:hypothetical protein